jgi:hypothetical protein
MYISTEFRHLEIVCPEISGLFGMTLNSRWISSTPELHVELTGVGAARMWRLAILVLSALEIGFLCVVCRYCSWLVGPYVSVSSPFFLSFPSLSCIVAPLQRFLTMLAKRRGLRTPSGACPTDLQGRWDLCTGKCTAWPRGPASSRCGCGAWPVPRTTAGRRALGAGAGPDQGGCGARPTARGGRWAGSRGGERRRERKNRWEPFFSTYLWH